MKCERSAQEWENGMELDQGWGSFLYILVEVEWLILNNIVENKNSKF